MSNPTHHKPNPGPRMVQQMLRRRLRKLVTDAHLYADGMVKAKRVDLTRLTAQEVSQILLRAFLLTEIRSGDESLPLKVTSPASLLAYEK